MHLWSKASENKELLELLNLSGWNYGVCVFFNILFFSYHYILFCARFSAKNWTWSVEQRSE